MTPSVCDAITRRNLLMFGYRGVVRVVEPHLYGRTTAGNEALSAWMREGWSRTDPEGGWRMFRLDELTDLSVLPEQFSGPRPDFNPDDRHFMEVFCRVGAQEPSASTSESAS
jgi:predicted DNA-binding transcriptional regulator YafY